MKYTQTDIDHIATDIAVMRGRSQRRDAIKKLINELQDDQFRQPRKTMKVKLIRTIKNLCGEIFRKNSVVNAEKTYGGYTLEKTRSKRKNVINGNGKFFYCKEVITMVKDTNFVKLEQKMKPENTITN